MKKTKTKKVIAPNDGEFAKLFAAAITEIAYCEMYPGSPMCQDDDFEDEEWDWVAEVGEE